MLRQWIVALLVGAFVASLPPVADAAAPIKIGCAAPITGPLAKMGADILHGVQMAVDQANARGGVLGSHLEVIVGDDKADPREGIVVANKLVQSGILGVVGHLNSGISIPTSKEVYAPAHVAMITPASTNPVLTERGLKNVFRTIGRDDQQGKDAATFALAHHYRSAVVLHNKNAYGQGLAEVFRANYAHGGGKVLLFDGITSGDKDFTPVLTRIRGLHPDLVFFGGEYQDGGLLVKQARRTGLKAPLMGGDGLYDKTFITLAGPKAAEGTLVTYPGKGNTGGFGAAYVKRYGSLGAYSAYAYDAANVLIDAIKRAGRPDRMAVMAQVARTRGFRGVSGIISFNAKGDQPGFKFAVWRVHNGDFQLVP